MVSELIISSFQTEGKEVRMTVESMSFGGSKEQAMFRKVYWAGGGIIKDCARWAVKGI